MSLPSQTIAAVQPLRKTSTSFKNARIAGLYDLGQEIGSGHFAVVKEARHVFTGETVAVKIIDKSSLDAQSAAHLMQEVRCMKLVQHPNIVRLYEVIDTQTRLFLILERGDCDLQQYISRHDKAIPESLAQQYFCQIITAIDYCHKLHVVHRDLKPENVVFFERLGMVKLTDFGFSNLYEPGQQLQTSCGSLAYSAPEILLGDAYDAPAVDVWSLGVILYMLVCSRLPFQETNDSETLTKILDCRYVVPDHLSNSCINLIQRMLVRDPSKRANLSEIVENPWVIAGDRGHAKILPLIVRHHLTHSAHTTIIEQMVAGRIGTEDEIASALENDEYNSMTATYYLLAERVLASRREEQAQELVNQQTGQIPDEDLIEQESRSSRPSSVAGSRCRSRSNSWRARPCTILKEESEEELSSYLRSASRQSSRFYQSMNIDRNALTSSRCSHFSRQSSDAAASTSAVSDDSPSSPRPHMDSLSVGGVNSERHLNPLSRQHSLFEDLSPIEEHGVLGPNELRSSEEPEEEMRCSNDDETLGTFISASVSRVVSDTEAELIPAKIRHLRRSKTASRLVRRNSSPSVSMFNASARDRISPQAVQDLLELRSIRRAASPDSVRSSRSPSPPASSSGRTSPAMLSLSSLSRLKVSTSAIGGMRKLSSSPHLLGICEEGEESTDGATAQHALSLHTQHSLGGIARTNRSASTGVVHIPSAAARHGPLQATKSSQASVPLPPAHAAASQQQPKRPASASSANSSVLSGSVAGDRKIASANPASLTAQTYSSVRMIRPRQAIVSPDVCRRYEKSAIIATTGGGVASSAGPTPLGASAVASSHPPTTTASLHHQKRFFISNTRRSTSCSSSEASDDEEGKRLSLSLFAAGSNYCRRRSDDNGDDEEDGAAGEGTNGQRRQNGPSNPLTRSCNTNGQVQQGEQRGHTATDGKGKSAKGYGERRYLTLDSPHINSTLSSPSSATSSSVASWCCASTAMPCLKAIPEMTQLDGTDRTEARRARLLQRSHTAEKILRDWAIEEDSEEHLLERGRDESWLGTPPRDPDALRVCGDEGTRQWIRRLSRARSHEELMKIPSLDSLSSAGRESVSFEGVRSGEAHALSDDSGCISNVSKRRLEFEKKAFLLSEDSWLGLDDAMLECARQQSNKEKVDYWLNTATFICKTH